MKRKTLAARVIFIAIVLMVTTVTAINIQAMQEVCRITETMDWSGKVEVSLKNYETGKKSK